MQSLASPLRRGDGPIWMIALGLSLLVNMALIAAFGFAALATEVMRKNSPVASQPPSAETVATIFAVTAPSHAAAQSAPAPVSEAKPRFARTSPDQSAPPPEHPAFIGERDTQATSDRAPTPGAPALPSQAGIAPRNDSEIETTESSYQDGSLTGGSPATPPAESTPAPPEPPAMERPAKAPGPVSTPSAPPPRERLMEGPNPVDVAVPRNTAEQSQIKPKELSQPAPDTSPPPAPKPVETPKVAETPKPKPIQDPAFRGYQRKTAVVGSISRNGRSALDVEDSPLGRYQAAISRAVELEWQRNCVRHRDFITPGFLTVRFFVNSNGKIRSVQFVGEMETGEIQKGFTLNSIRDAEIPPMPPALRKEFDKEPLELIFRFYF